MKDKGTTYRDAGVDIDAGDALVERIKPLARRTARPEVLAGIGGFGGLFEAPKGYREPVMVVGTDGVGTKLKLAFMAGKHDTVGIDLVAMSVNDVVVCGAEPVVFLDYFATSRLEVAEAEQVIKGIAEGCVRAGCALIGGETAELPGFYGRGEYDLAGFCVGVVEKSRILDGSQVKAADVVLGMASSGLHSNGFSLVRKVFESDLPAALARELLEPTRPPLSTCSRAVGRRRSRSASSRASPGYPSPRWSSLEYADRRSRLGHRIESASDPGRVRLAQHPRRGRGGHLQHPRREGAAAR